MSAQESVFSFAPKKLRSSGTTCLSLPIGSGAHRVSFEGCVLSTMARNRARKGWPADVLGAPKKQTRFCLPLYFSPNSRQSETSGLMFRWRSSCINAIRSWAFFRRCSISARVSFASSSLVNSGLASTNAMPSNNGCRYVENSVLASCLAHSAISKGTIRGFPCPRNASPSYSVISKVSQDTSIPPNIFLYVVWSSSSSADCAVATVLNATNQSKIMKSFKPALML